MPSIVSLTSIAAILLAACLPAHAIGTQSAPLPISVDPASRQFVDSLGRIRIFHGVNAVYKLEPWYPTLTGFDTSNTLSETDMENLAKWGFNVVRLGVMWRPTEPEQGVYNQTFLHIMRDLADRMGSYGIYTNVDAHQDSLSRQFCGEGFPDFAIQPNAISKDLKFPFPIPVKIPDGPDGYPNLTACQQVIFSAYELTVEESSAWETFYTSLTLREQFASFWGQVASAFNSSTAVLSYELLNEPWFGDVYRDPLRFLDSAKSDQDYLAPLYEAAYKKIRAVDPDHIVLYEPTVTESVLNEASGFTTGPGGPSDNDKQGFAFHAYCFNQNKTGDITNVTACTHTLEGVFANMRKNAKAAGGGSFVTEFGAVGSEPSSAQAIEAFGNIADEDLSSWSYWTFKSYQDITTQNSASESLYNADGSLQELKLKALSRTYAQAIAGVPGSASMTFSPENGNFVLSYTINSAAQGPTEVYLNEDLHYPAGYTVSISPSSAGVVDTSVANRVTVTHPTGTAGVFTLKIAPKA